MRSTAVKARKKIYGPRVVRPPGVRDARAVGPPEHFPAARSRGALSSLQALAMACDAAQ